MTYQVIIAREVNENVLPAINPCMSQVRVVRRCWGMLGVGSTTALGTAEVATYLVAGPS